MKRIYALIAISLIFIVPFISQTIIGIPPDFFSFPMKVHYVNHSPFSLFATGVFVCLYFIYIISIFGLALRSQSINDKNIFRLAPNDWWYFENPRKIYPEKSYFPYWGYVGAILALTAWCIAWIKPESLGDATKYTFSPTWFGIVLTLDGLVFYRMGSSLFSRNKIQFILICVISSASWWLFEYLNLYVQNWWYQVDESLQGIQKYLTATAAFMTVTPAMLELAALLTSFSFITDYFSKGSRVLGKGSGRVKAFFAVIAGVTSLFLIPFYPNELFFLVWVSPLLICEGMLYFAGIITPIAETGSGRFGKLVVLNISALLCGFIWETLNYYSYPKWFYTVPYIQGPQLFEMPIVGYFGYLTFGPLTWCLLLTFWLLIFGKRVPDEKRMPIANSLSNEFAI